MSRENWYRSLLRVFGRGRKKRRPELSLEASANELQKVTDILVDAQRQYHHELNRLNTLQKEKIKEGDHLTGKILEGQIQLVRKQLANGFTKIAQIQKQLCSLRDARVNEVVASTLARIDINVTAMSQDLEEAHQNKNALEEYNNEFEDEVCSPIDDVDDSLYEEKCRRFYEIELARLPVLTDEPTGPPDGNDQPLCQTSGDEPSIQREENSDEVKLFQDAELEVSPKSSDTITPDKIPVIEAKNDEVSLRSEKPKN